MLKQDSNTGLLGCSPNQGLGFGVQKVWRDILPQIGSLVGGLQTRRTQILLCRWDDLKVFGS